MPFRPTFSERKCDTASAVRWVRRHTAAADLRWPASAAPARRQRGSTPTRRYTSRTVVSSVCLPSRHLVEDGNENQSDDVGDRHHVETGCKRSGLVTQDAEHLRAEVSEETGAEADDAHRMARFVARHHAAGQSIELIRSCES